MANFDLFEESVSTPEVKPPTFFKLFTLEMPKGSITPQGMQRVREITHATVGDAWETGFEWVWQNKHGNFSKRFQKALYQAGRRKMEPEMIAKVVQAAKDNTYDENKIMYDFANECDWVNGDFGDANSCYWSMFPEALATVFGNGGFAIRAFQPITEKMTSPYGYDRYPGVLGMGRGWVFPMKLGEQSYWLVTNGYIAGRSSYFFARLLAAHYGWTYKAGKVQAANDGVYWNEGGNVFFVAPQDIIARIPDTVSPSLPVKHKHLAVWVCRKCRKTCATDHKGTPHSTRPYLKTNQGPFCPDCTPICDVCCKNRCTPKMEPITLSFQRTDVQNVCEVCLQSITKEPCLGCGKRHFSPEVTYLADRTRNVCHVCREGQASPWVKCHGCGYLSSVKDVRTLMDDKRYCKVCAPHKIAYFEALAKVKNLSMEELAALKKKNELNATMRQLTADEISYLLGRYTSTCRIV
jgi:hypothetical protein